MSVAFEANPASSDGKDSGLADGATVLRSEIGGVICVRQVVVTGVLVSDAPGVLIGQGEGADALLIRRRAARRRRM